MPVAVTAGVTAFPIVACLVGCRVCDRLPDILQHGFHGLWGAGGVRLSFRRSLPFFLPAAAVLAQSGANAGSLFGFSLLLSGLAVAAMVDIEYGLLPRLIQIPLLSAGLLAPLVGVGLVSLSAALTGAVALWLCVRGLQCGLSLIVGGCHDDVIGDGDLLLATVIGAWFGLGVGVMVLVLAVLFLLLSLLALVVRGTPARSAFLPFAPFVLASTSLTVSLWPIN